MNSQEYLENVLWKHKLDEGEVERIKNIRKEVENKLKNIYGSKIEKIIYSGSYAKNTAVDLKYDVDLCIYFKNDSFSTLFMMYNDVFTVLRKNFPKYRIRKQNVSLRLVLSDNRSIDIVPVRSFEDGTGDANLYSSKTNGPIKTNIRKHIEYISKSKTRPIIKLIKIWKIEHNIHFKSFALELLVIKALSSSNSNDYGTQFLEVLEYIRDNAATVKLIDPANSNNNVSDSIDYVDKFNISKHARSSRSKRYFEDIVW